MEISVNFMKEKNQISNDVKLMQHPLLNGQFLSTYEEVLSYSQLKLYQEINFRNVKIYEDDYLHEIYTSKDSDLPHIVILHGYGGTALMNVRLFSKIFQHYQVHALDTFGIGYSSRGKWDDNFTFEQTKDYYINAIQQWRKALKINKFYLAGHSFGGYIATLYAEEFPQKIQKLFLLSPAGGTDYNHTQEVIEEMTCSRKVFYCIGQIIYNRQIRPTAAFKNFFFGQKILERALGGRLKLQGQQKQLWKKYLKQVGSQKKSSQVGFYRLFNWPLSTKYPIQNIIRKNKFPFSIEIYYGDSDWMNKNGAQRLEKENRVKVQKIQNSGHQVIMDNSKMLGQFLVKNKI